jgi:hypothetical protein
MKGVLPVMIRLTTISYFFPFPLTVHAPKNIMKLLNTKLLQGPLEHLLGIKDPKLLLHLLEEARSMEPEHLLQIPGCTLLLHTLRLPAVQFVEIFHPHPTRQGRVDANTPG